MIHLDQPFRGNFPVTQGFANLLYSEPLGYRYADGSIGYAGGGIPGHWHNGIDYGLPCGTPLYAPADGTVSSAGWDSTGFGNCTRINHGEVSTLYGHQSKLLVSAGQAVKRGQRIGLSGTTGNSTGCHLHWSVTRNSDGHYIDPAPFLAAPAPTPPAPQDGINHVSFSVVTMAACTLWDGPSKDLHPMGHLDKGEQVVCDASMHGQPSRDLLTGALDHRWYHNRDGGWVASARVSGNAPGSTP